MRTIPYGYRIDDGKIVIDEEEAVLVKKVFDLYLENTSLNSIRKETGIGKHHITISNILEDRRYKGTEFYPRIIDDATFDQAASLRSKKRQYKKKEKPTDKPKTQFVMDEPQQHFDEPYKQAEYIYSLIKEA